MTELDDRPRPTRPAGWRRLLVLRPALVDFARRGFRTGPADTRATLEAAAGAFLDGFNAELAVPAHGAPDLSVFPEHAITMLRRIVTLLASAPTAVAGHAHSRDRPARGPGR